MQRMLLRMQENNRMKASRFVPMGWQRSARGKESSFFHKKLFPLGQILSKTEKIKEVPCGVLTNGRFWDNMKKKSEKADVISD